MTAVRLEGRPLATTILAACRERIAVVSALLPTAPAVGLLLVGHDAASDLYARRIERSCRQVGLRVETNRLPEDAGTDAVVAGIAAWNAEPTVCGIVVQFPLPASVDAQAIVQAIDPSKDLDGAHPINFGRIALGLPGFAPCTAEAIVEIARSPMPEIAGVRCVVVGRSNIVGKPAALLLVRAHATVTLCHTRTRELPELTRSATLVVAAAGRPGLIGGDMLAPGAIVIDAGTTVTEGGLVGDVVFDEAMEVAGAVTPVPGGVGPVTNAILMRHAAEAAEHLVRLPRHRPETRAEGVGIV